MAIITRGESNWQHAAPRGRFDARPYLVPHGVPNYRRQCYPDDSPELSAKVACATLALTPAQFSNVTSPLALNFAV